MGVGNTEILSCDENKIILPLQRSRLKIAKHLLWGTPFFMLIILGAQYWDNGELKSSYLLPLPVYAVLVLLYSLVFYYTAKSWGNFVMNEYFIQSRKISMWSYGKIAVQWLRIEKIELLPLTYPYSYCDDLFRISLAVTQKNSKKIKLMLPDLNNEEFSRFKTILLVLSEKHGVTIDAPNP